MNRARGKILINIPKSSLVIVVTFTVTGKTSCLRLSINIVSLHAMTSAAFLKLLSWSTPLYMMFTGSMEFPIWSRLQFLFVGLNVFLKYLIAISLENWPKRCWAYTTARDLQFGSLRALQTTLFTYVTVTAFYLMIVPIPGNLQLALHLFV